MSGLPALLVQSSLYWKCTKYSTPFWDSRVGNYLRSIEREREREKANVASRCHLSLPRQLIIHFTDTHTKTSSSPALAEKREQCIPQQRPLYRIKRLCCRITPTRCHLSYPACPATISNICSQSGSLCRPTAYRRVYKIFILNALHVFQCTHSPTIFINMCVCRLYVCFSELKSSSVCTHSLCVSNTVFVSCCCYCYLFIDST